MTNKGLLVVVDGPSGAGKDTLITKLSKKEIFGRTPVVLTEETLDPNREAILEARSLGKARGGTGDTEMALTIVRHREQIYKAYFDPVFEQDGVVLANRGEPATMAYQTYKKELSIKQVWEIHRGFKIRIPDFVVLALCMPETAVAREQNSNSNIRREQESGSGLSGKVSHESGDSLAAEIERRREILLQYAHASEFLRERGVKVLTLFTDKMSTGREVKAVLSFLEQ